MTGCRDAMKAQGRQRRQSGVALVTTMIVVAVLAVVAVAFMQSTSTDRLSSRTVKNYMQARLAAEAGLAQFMAQLSEVVATGEFTVLELEDPNDANRRFTAVMKFSSGGSAEIVPLASRPVEAEPAALRAPFDLAAIYRTASGAVGGGGLDIIRSLERYGQDGASVVDYPASQVQTLILPAAKVKVGEDERAEYAYIAIDESAKLNVSLFGAEYEGEPRIKQEVEEFAGQVALADSGPHSVSLGQLRQFNELPTGLRLGAIWPSLYADQGERRAKNRFYSGHRGQVFDYIPFGYLDDNLTTWRRMADGGQLKFDINALVAEDDDADPRPAHERIADIINRNLPDWHKRDPALLQSDLKPANHQLRYLRRIAAAIVDYIDDDDQITLLEDGEPAGKEAVAYPFKIIERYDWVGATRDLDAGGDIPVWNLTIRHTVFVELWNPHTVPVAGTLDFTLRSFREFYHPREITDNPFYQPEFRGSVEVLLRPNEIDVYKIGEQTFSGVSFETNAPSKPIYADNTSSRSGQDAENKYHSRYSASWNGQIYSYTPNELPMFAPHGPGVGKQNGSISNSPTSARPVFHGSVPQNVRVGNVGFSVGDPRQAHFSNYPWSDFSHVNARYKGANHRPQYGVSGQPSQIFEETWDSRDALRAALPAGSRATATRNPDDVQATYDEATDGRNAIAVIRNAPMETIAELGHIYDPADLNDSGANRGTVGFPDSYFGLAGGRTLRIGQPEFNYPSYNLAGQRSYSLLDLFTTSMGKGDLGERTSGINLNTAPEEVLTSFLYNMAPRSDEGVGMAGSPPRLSLEGARNVARAVIDNRPYFAASDYHKFTEALQLDENFEPAVTTKPDGSLQMLDRGREEIFRRAYNYLDTKSGAFKFYGLGRALALDGKVVSEAALEAQVELRAEADEDGNVRLRPVVTQKKFL
jgi:Tfp pilus assembly protein PilE